MTATSHAVTGMLVGLAVKDTTLAVPLAFLSHFVVDAIPHFSFGKDELFSKKFNAYLILDLVSAGILAGAFLFVPQIQSFHVFACIVAAVIPDIVWAYYWLYQKHLKKITPNLGIISRFHMFVQSGTDPSKKTKGARNELLWIAFLLLLLYIASR